MAALEQWPRVGHPGQPGRLADGHRASTAPSTCCAAARRLERKHEELGRELELRAAMLWRPELGAAVDDADRRRPAQPDVQPPATRCSRPRRASALTLRLFGGLTTDEIARAFLVPEPTIAQRIVRAKRTLAEARVPFEVPGPASSLTGSASVLEVIYLIFNEGYAASAGEDWMRPELCEEALRLGRILAGLLPAEPEVHGLVALMEIQASRAARPHRPRRASRCCCSTRTARAGTALLIRRGLAALERGRAARRHARAVRPAGRDRRLPRPRARRRRTPTGRGSSPSTTALAQLAPSPVVELNRAVAVAMAYGPGGGARARRRARRRARAERLPPAAERARRPAGPARPRRRGTGRAPARRIAGGQRARAPTAA